MPTPFKRLLYTVVRLETKSRDGSTSAATSFAFRDAASPPGQDLFLVSNKHAVDGSDQAYLYFAETGPDGKPMLGEPFYVENDMFHLQWHGHPDDDVDVAVMPL